MPSTCGSRILEGYMVAYGATAVRRIRELGGIVAGKTNLDEFGMASTTEASGYQEAHLMVLRLSNALLRLEGILRKVFGSWPFWTLLLFSVLSRDLIGAISPRPWIASLLCPCLAQAAADELSALYGDSGAKGLRSEMPILLSLTVEDVMEHMLSPPVIMMLTIIVPSRTIIRKSFEAPLDENDILISPASPSAAYKIGIATYQEKKDDPLATYGGDIMTVNVKSAGLPALVVPAGFVDGGSIGLPVGLRMIGAAFEEEKLRKVANLSLPVSRTRSHCNADQERTKDWQE
ncbi:hypothetical protein MLD38_033289 [Melastoma candidum]|uniref:Uncharacterized protein n=1 Tax=Melastoma candidum TaxID=119954 RepID=A0ACB9M6D9_9MYRT|nr:hypothetical protein MLD38_033289 [Melastoma candidum]